MTYPHNSYSDNPFDPTRDAGGGYPNYQPTPPTGTLNTGNAVSTAWQIMKNNWQGFLLGTLVAFLGVAVVYLVMVFGTFARTEMGVADTAGTLFLVFLVVAVSFLSSAVNLLAYRSASDAVAGEPITFSKFFDFNRFGGLLLTWLLIGLISLLGMILLVIPGLVFAFLAIFAYPAYLRNPSIGPWGAIKQSIQVTKNNIAETLLFVLLSMGVSLVAGWTVIGVVFAIPFLALVATVLYEQSRGADSLLLGTFGVNDPSGFTGAYPYTPGAGADNPYRPGGSDQGYTSYPGYPGNGPTYPGYPGNGPTYPGSGEQTLWQGYQHPENTTNDGSGYPGNGNPDYPSSGSQEPPTSETPHDDDPNNPTQR